jgi:hypothetical protein
VDERTKIKIRNLILLDELNKLYDVFQKENINLFVIKGTSLILKNIFDIDEREMSDIDVFVKKNDFKNIEFLLYKFGFKKIEEGYNSYYKEIGGYFAPIIFDIHYDFIGIKFDDIETENTEYKNIKASSLIDDFIITSIHSVVRHGYLGKKDLEDLFRIYREGVKKYSDFINRVIKKSEKFGFGYIVYLCFKKIGVNLEKPSLKFREIFSIPFVKLSFLKHIRLNEYILPLFYDKELVKNKIKRFV